MDNDPQRLRPGNRISEINAKSVSVEEEEKRMKDDRPDYFATVTSEEDAIVRGIKGNFRRQMILKSLMAEGAGP